MVRKIYSNKIFYIISLIIFLTSFFISPGNLSSAPTDDYVTTWKTNNAGTSNSTSITIPTFGAGYNFDVDWNNDGTFDQFNITNVVTHNFGVAGTYTIRIRGAYPRIYFFSSGDKQKILSVDQWGSTAWTSMENAFYGCSNFTLNATDVPNLSAVRSTKNMFRNATSFNTNISSWNTSLITNMSYMFNGATSYNQPLSTWDTSSVTNMSYMFSGATSFNQDISSWNVSKVSDMSNMFTGATSYNQPLSTWDTSLVLNMWNMFSSATSFNQDISAWNTSKVNDMSYMFSSATSFNQNLSSWDTSLVDDMGGMFRDASSFNGDISLWDTSLVSNMYGMFWGATAFNKNISSWDTSSVTIMESMFYGATSFNQNISTWNVSSVDTMLGMFNEATSFNQNISSWNTSAVIDMEDMFNGATSFNQDISSWNVSLVEYMDDMFYGVTLSNANYDAILDGWSDQVLTSGINFHAGSSKYCNSGTQRESIISTYGWVITDGGLNTGCPTPALPTLTTEVASSLTTSTATLNGTITATGGANPTVRGFEYGLTTSYGTTTTENGDFTTGAYTANITSLTCGTTYHARSYATNSGGTSYGTDISFDTVACAPTINPPILTTEASSLLTETTATLNGTITVTGGANPTIRGFEYGLTTSYGTTTTENGDFTTGAYNANITSLTCGTTYHARSYATNSAGKSYGSDVSFDTNACALVVDNSRRNSRSSGSIPAFFNNTNIIENNNQFDICPNIAGVQNIAPFGLVIDEASNCVTPQLGIKFKIDEKIWVPDICVVNPTHKSCIKEDKCILQPNDPACKKLSFCEKNPTDPTCSNKTFCDLNPSDISCLKTVTNPCILNPLDKSCITTSTIEEEKKEKCQGIECIINSVLGDNFFTSLFTTIQDSTLGLLSGISTNLYSINNKVTSAFTDPVGRVVATTISTTGILIGAFYGVVNTIFAGPIAFSEIFLIPVRLWTLLMIALGFKKRQSPWGTVYDSTTKQPLDPVYVVLQDLNGKEIATSITDLDGRYGFLVPKGMYKIFTNKTNYEFPSKKLSGQTKDALYDELYFNEIIEVEEDGQVITKNIPMDAIKFDWNEFAKRDQNLMKFYSKREALISKFMNILYSIGFIVSIISTLISPVFYNILIFSLYLLMYVLSKTILKPRAFGYVKFKDTDIPLSYAIIRFFYKGGDNEVTHKITDMTGKYYCLLANGEYYAKIDNKNVDESYTTIYTSEPIDVDRGYINEKFEV